LQYLYPPSPTAATLANQSDEYGDVAAELGPKRLRFKKPNARFGVLGRSCSVSPQRLMALSSPTVYAQHASNNPLATANDVFGLTLGLESIGLDGLGLVRENLEPAQ
jgi:hypothetical protein